VLSFLILLGVTAQTPASAALTLDDALARALASNRTIAAARLAGPVSKAGVDVARERPNPELTYEAERELPHQAIGGSIPIELGGKRQRRIDLANATLLATDAELDRVIADVQHEVRRAYFSLVAANERVTIANDVRALAVRARDAAQVRFAAGDSPRLEAVQTQLALADADNEVTAATGEASAARAELNVLIGQPASAALTVTSALTLRPLPSLEEAVATASKSNVALALLDKRIAEQEARRAVAKSLQTPDVTAGSSFTYQAQPDFSYGWRLNFGVTLPVFTKHRAGVVVEEAELARLRAERMATEEDIAGSVTAALARATALSEALRRYQSDILPAAADVEQMAQDGYSAGQTGLVALLQALQSTRDIRRRGLQAGLEFQLALADLERAIGARTTR